MRDIPVERVKSNLKGEFDILGVHDDADTFGNDADVCQGVRCKWVLVFRVRAGVSSAARNRIPDSRIVPPLDLSLGKSKFSLEFYAQFGTHLQVACSFDSLHHLSLSYDTTVWKRAIINSILN